MRWTASLRSAQKNPVGAHSICARESMRRRKRVRADIESAPTNFVFDQREKTPQYLLFLIYSLLFEQNPIELFEQNPIENWRCT